MFLMFMAVLGVASVPLAGGSLSRLAELRLRGLPLVFGALLLQVLDISVVHGLPGWLAAGVHVLTYLMAGVAAWLNRRVVGVPLLALGGALNGLAIVANDGTLPASARALRAAGIRFTPGDFTNSGLLAHPHLAWLGDMFTTPAFLPLRNVFSVGDVLILVGCVVMAHAAGRSRLADWVGRGYRPVRAAATAGVRRLVGRFGGPPRRLEMLLGTAAGRSTETIDGQALVAAVVERPSIPVTEPSGQR